MMCANNNQLITPEYDFTLIELQRTLEKNQSITYIKTGKYYKLKQPDNHIDLLNYIIISNIRNGGFVSVSKVIKDFIEVCTSKSCNINLSLNEESCILFIKNSIKKLDFNIIQSYQKKSKHTTLQFSIDLESLDQLHFNLPMITTPRDWILTEDCNNAILGGYLHNEDDLVKLIKSNYRLNSSDTNLSERLITLINRLHKVRFSTDSLYNSYETHKIEYEKNLLLLENMKQDSKYEKALYYMFMDEYITHAKMLVKSYEDFIKIIRNNHIKYFHFLFNICFRGRVYASGLISPTSDKVLRRYLIPYNHTNNDDIIEMDASASILQILATISCSTKLAKITNIFNDDVDTWSHIHQLIIELSISDIDIILNHYFINNSTKVFPATDVFDTIYLIDRNIVKYTIMRILYGSNPYQISTDFRNEYSINNLSYKHITIIYAAFFHNFKDEIDVLKIIKMLNRYMMKHNSRGIYVNNNFISYENTYYKTNTKSIKFRDNNNKIREVEVYLKSSELDINKSCNASCPNLFHSIDSEICLNIIEEFLDRSKFIFTIHDAFIIRKSDKELLIKLYNQYLFSQHTKLIDLIESHINIIKPTIKDLTFINNYLRSIKERKIEYKSLSNKMFSSNFTLKNNVKREFHTTIMNNKIGSDNNNNNTHKYSIDLKPHVNEIDILLNLFADKLLSYYPNYFIPGYLMIYSQHIQYIGGPSLRVSSPLFRLDQVHECIEQFKGKLDHYGTSAASYIPIVQTIKFTQLNDESFSLIMRIDQEMKTSLASKPKDMNSKLWLTMEHIISKIDTDLKLPDMGIGVKTRTSILDHINFLKDSYNTSSKVENNNLSPQELKYILIVNEIKIEEAKPRDIRDRKIINTKRTLANYYIRKFGFTRRHYYTDKDNPLGFYENEVDYNQIYYDISDEFEYNMKIKDILLNEKYGKIKAKRIIDKRYITRKSFRHLIRRKENIIAADFETIVVNGKHYVFCSSICFSPNKNKNKCKEKGLVLFSPFRDFEGEYEKNVVTEFSRSYINTNELMEDLSNIEELSNRVLLNFWNDLTYIIENRITVKTKPVIYFHNMDKFDGIFILKLISLLLDTKTISVEEISIIQRNNIIYEIKIGSICIRDSLHLLTGSLNKLAKTFINESKKEIDIKFNYKSIVENEKMISEYCDHDTYLLFRVMRKFKIKMIQMYYIDPTSLITISALSFSILRHHYISNKYARIENSSNDLNKHEFIQKSYRGGFSGVFIPLEEEYIITHIDINSSYPHSMTLHLPVGLGMWLHYNYIMMINKSIDIINRDLLYLFGFFDVRINVKEMRSISPLIIKYEGKLTDVTGEIRVTIFSEELKFIMCNGGELLEVYSGIIYDDFPVLKRFAEELYNKRRNSKDNTEKMIYKLILNSAYGRFALKESEEQTKVCTNEQFDVVNDYRITSNDIDLGDSHKLFILHKSDNDNKIDFNTDDSFLYKLVNSKINSSALRGIQIASAIASYSRINLLQTIFNIEDKGYKVYYVDTDSIYTNMPATELKEMNIISNELGDWKIENEGLRGIFIQSKFYLTQKKGEVYDIKLKSVPKDAVRDLENDKNVWEIFLNRLRGNPIIIKADKYFLRNVRDKSVDVRLNIQFKLEDKSNLKREPIYNNVNEWIATKSYKLSYNSDTSYKTRYSVMKNYGSPSNIEILRISINFTELENEIINYVKIKLEKSVIKLPLIITLSLSSYNLCKYEIRLLISNISTHLVRIVVALDNRTLSSSFISLNEALEYISEVEELYKFHILNNISIINKCEKNIDVINVIINAVESSLSKIDQSEIIPEDVRIMMQLFMKVIQSENIIEGFEKYYKEICSLVYHIMIRSMEYLGVTEEYEKSDIYNMIRMFIVDQIIKGFPIRDANYSKLDQDDNKNE